MSNRKVVAETTTQKIQNVKSLTRNNDKPKKIKFQYDCSFCRRELPNGGIRFNGIGACPYHFTLAQELVEGLRELESNYLYNLGVHK